jgi:hypothetical protein
VQVSSDGKKANHDQKDQGIGKRKAQWHHGFERGQQEDDSEAGYEDNQKGRRRANRTAGGCHASGRRRHHRSWRGRPTPDRRCYRGGEAADCCDIRRRL